MAMTWSNEEIQRLVDCSTPDEWEAAFPDVNPKTLRNNRARFMQGLNAGGRAELGWTPVPGGTPPLTSDDLGRISIESNTRQNSPAGWSAGVEVTGESGTICSGPVEKPITDWSEILTIWGLDPDQFEVVEPVTFKAWDTPAKDENTQEIISRRLFSYKARIQRKKADAEIKVDTVGWQTALQTVNFTSDMTRHVHDDNATSYVVCVADPQLGKPGTEESILNWKRGITEHAYVISKLALDTNRRLSEIVIAFMGDEHEGVVGNYANQPYVVELSYSEQIQLDFDLRVWTIKTLLELGLPVRVISVPSNHGEHTRFGSAKPMTSPYDNSSTMVARLVKKLFDESGFEDKIEWLIADDQPDVVTDLNGIKAYFAHGHVAKGSGIREQKVKSAIDRQILGRTNDLGDVTLFFTAHYHHFYSIEDRGRTIFGCPALEAEKSSQWYFDQYGAWSKPGMLGLLVGSALGGRGWESVNIL